MKIPVNKQVSKSVYFESKIFIINRPHLIVHSQEKVGNKYRKYLIFSIN